MRDRNTNMSLTLHHLPKFIPIPTLKKNTDAAFDISLRVTYNFALDVNVDPNLARSDDDGL